jgi:hypothetical protein
MVDQNSPLPFVKDRCPAVENMDFSQLKWSKRVVQKLKEMFDGRGPDFAIECVAGENPKSCAHSMELAIVLETDTGEIAK